ncbi:MAG: formylglycine-generating enzyme family protein [Spirochaetota bacterium]
MPAIFTNSLGMKFTIIQPGQVESKCNRSEIINHKKCSKKLIKIKKSYYMGVFEVTQRQWKQLMRNNPSRFKGCLNCPVESISKQEAERFIQKLNNFDKNGKVTYRLPTADEWEYAARGGSKSKYFWGDDKSLMYKYANICDKNCIKANRMFNLKQDDGYKYTSPVGTYLPNNFGLYDVIGNTQEWVSDYEFCWGGSCLDKKTKKYYCSSFVGGDWGDSIETVDFPSLYYGSKITCIGTQMSGFRILADIKTSKN